MLSIDVFFNNFCKDYNYSFNSLAIFCGNRIELLTPLFFNIRYWLQTDFFSLWWNKVWRCISVCWSYYLSKFAIFFQLTTNYHISLILVLVLSHIDQRLSIQSLQLRLKSANKKKNRLYFIKYSTCLLVLEKANCNKNLIKCFASIYLVLLIIWVFVIAHPVFFHSTRLWLNKNDPMKRFIKNILTI